MTNLLSSFLSHFKTIVTTCTYRQPGVGDDGTADCIGAIIGALKRCKIAWSGIHGSNYAARYQSVELSQIKSVNQLSVGEAVFKARPQGNSSWDLPRRYQYGGQYYNGDLNDYYHVGVVTSINPLMIMHMTSPVGKTDTTLGKWGYHCKIKPLVFAGAYDDNPETEPEPEPVPVPEPRDIPTPEPEPQPIHPNAGAYATVVAEKGRYVKLRQKPSTKCRLYEEVPIGAVVRIDTPGEEWAKVDYGRRKGWYMMAKFLELNG